MGSEVPSATLYFLGNLVACSFNLLVEVITARTQHACPERPSSYILEQDSFHQPLDFLPDSLLAPGHLSGGRGHSYQVICLEVPNKWGAEVSPDWDKEPLLRVLEVSLMLPFARSHGLGFGLFVCTVYPSRKWMLVDVLGKV